MIIGTMREMFVGMLVCYPISHLAKCILLVRENQCYLSQ